MKLVIMAIGIPGSGKTTTLKPLAERHGMRHVNRDEIREEWFGEPHIQVAKEAVWEETERRVQEALGASQPVLLDATFTEPDKRVSMIMSARAAGAERVVGVVFTTPLEVAMQQNQDREYSVAGGVIEMMHAQLAAAPPHLEEGFDALYTSEELEELEEELRRG
jgi:predicted kinase